MTEAQAVAKSYQSRIKKILDKLRIYARDSRKFYEVYQKEHPCLKEYGQAVAFETAVDELEMEFGLYE